MYWHAAGIQYVCHKAVTVAVVPEWQSLIWITNLDSKCLKGSKYGNLVALLTGVLWICPPQCSSLLASMNSRS